MYEILIAILYILAGGSILVAGGEILVRGATRIALLIGISPLVVGLTVIASCTSAPELTVSLMGCLQEGGTPEIAIGNAVGSNICNILLILGFTGVICPIAISAKMIKQEIPFLIVISGLFWVIAMISYHVSGVHFMPQWGGAVFIVVLLIYVAWTIREARREENTKLADQIKEHRMSSPIPEKEVKIKRTMSFYLCESILSLLLITVGLAFLIFGSDLFIKGSVSVATFIGVSTLVISLTVLAVGTSLPELVVSAVAAFKGKTDIAIGNIVGSNIFNLLGILGLTSVLVQGGLDVSPMAFWYDIPIMFGTTVIGGYFCITGKTFERWEGFTLLAFYVGYVVFLFCRS